MIVRFGTSDSAAPPYAYSSGMEAGAASSITRSVRVMSARALRRACASASPAGGGGVRTMAPGGALIVRWFRSSFSPLIPCSTIIVMSPNGLIDSVRSILSGSCRSIVTSPLNCRSPIVRSYVPLHVSACTLLMFFSPPSAARAWASSCSAFVSPCRCATKPPSVIAREKIETISRCTSSPRCRAV